VCRRVALFAAVLAALAFLGLGFAFYNVTRPEPPAPSGPAPVAVEPTSQEQRAARRTLERLENRLEEAAGEDGDSDPRETKPEAAEMRITEDELNQLIRGLPEVRRALRTSRISAPRVEFQPDRLTASARVPVFGEITARVSASGRLWAEKGALAYELEQVKVGDFPAPAAVRRSLDRALRDGVRQLNQQIKLEIVQVTLADGELVVQGRP
jgi:hypothetical protein